MAAMIFPFRHLQQIREDNRTIAEENAWNDFLDKVTKVTQAQRAMDEAHRAYLAIKYPKGTSRD